MTKTEYEDYRKRLLAFTEFRYSEDVKYTKEDIVMFANAMLRKLLEGYVVAREVGNDN